MSKWRLEGLDTFEGEPYPLPGEYGSQKEAEEAAAQRMGRLEKTQPSETSGGQSFDGIQDRIYIIRPDGTTYRYIPAIIDGDAEIHFDGKYFESRNRPT